MKNFIIILVFSLTFTSIAQIDSNYIFYYNNVKYELVKSKYTWFDAANVAKNRLGKLAEINSREEQDSINYYLSIAGINKYDSRAEDGGNATYVWIGGNDYDNEGYWYWDGNNDGYKIPFWIGDVSGSPVDNSFTNWGNEPDNFSNQDGLGLAITDWPLGDAGEWNDVKINNSLYSLIEYDNTTINISDIIYDYDIKMIFCSFMSKLEYEEYMFEIDSIFYPLENVSEGKAKFNFDVENSKQVAIRLFGKSDSILATSKLHKLDILSLNNPVSSYKTLFEEVEVHDDFLLTDFTIDKIFPFRNYALNSEHDYKDSAEAVAILGKPIIIGSNFNISFTEVVMIEPGEPNSSYLDDNFKDYVIVEATNNFTDWYPLIDGYDSSADSLWLDVWYNGGLLRNYFKKRAIKSFSPFNFNDTILVRFRLFADERINGWGWLIDSLTIQDEFTSINNSEFKGNKFRLNQNYPNPFNPTTTISFELAKSAPVTLSIYNQIGELVKTVINDKYFENGNNKLDITIVNQPSGVYYYELQTLDFREVKKMVLIK